MLDEHAVTLDGPIEYISGNDSSHRRVRFDNVRKEDIVDTNITRDSNEDGLLFDTSKQAFTPQISQVQYRNPAERVSVTSILAPPSSLVRPNYEDILRRVSVVIHQHISKCEAKLASESTDNGTLQTQKIQIFSEENFLSPQYVYHFVRAPICRVGFLYGIRKISKPTTIPNLAHVHTFLRDLFVKAQLSAECSIVCLIYVERLMETAKVPLVSTTWRPCLLCGLLLASKVWQDLSSWNSEISQIYPQFSLQSINRLERIFCQEIKWDLYISSSAYAKYYFALRSLTEKKDFRRNYNIMMIAAPGAQQVAERSEGIKEAVLATVLSRSL